MLSKEDFMFTVGFQGNSAIVDSRMKRRYAKASIDELLKEGLYKPALCASIMDQDEKGLESIITYYNEQTTVKITTIDELKRVFGISKIPDEIEKVIRI
jgi:hypothetical protein